MARVALHLDEARPTVPPAIHWRITFSPGHYPSGMPVNRHASRQVLAERLWRVVEAPTADAAVAHFERTENLMVTACERADVGEVLA